MLEGMTPPPREDSPSMSPWGDRGAPRGRGVPLGVELAVAREVVADLVLERNFLVEVAQVRKPIASGQAEPTPAPATVGRAGARPLSLYAAREKRGWGITAA
jgi:hypothetical protein